MSPAIITLIILLVALVLFVTEKIPMGLTAFLVSFALYAFGVIDVKNMFSEVVNTNVILVCAMFVIGEAFFQTGMAYKTGTIISHIAKTERSLLIVVMVVGGVMSGFLSNTGTVAVLMPIVIGICQKNKISPIKLLIPLSISATIGADLSLIGSPGNLIANAAIQDYSKGALSFGFFEYSKLGIPLLVASIAFMYFFGYKLIPERDAGEFSSGDFDYTKVPKWKGYLTLAVLLLTIVAMVFESQIKIPLYISACVGAVVLVLTGVLSEKEAFRSFNMTVIFLMAFMLPLSSALESSGASQMITDAIISVAGKSSPFILMAALWILTGVMTQFMSNTAACALLCPIGVSIAASLGADPRAVVMSIFIASSVAVATPLAIPANAMIMGPAGCKFKDFARTGIPIIIIEFVISMILLPIFYPFFP